MCTARGGEEEDYFLDTKSDNHRSARDPISQIVQTMCAQWRPDSGKEERNVGLHFISLHRIRRWLASLVSFLFLVDIWGRNCRRTNQETIAAAVFRRIKMGRRDAVIV